MKRSHRDISAKSGGATNVTDIIYTELMSRADVNWLIRKKFDVSLGLFYIIETNMFFIVLM